MKARPTILLLALLAACHLPAQAQFAVIDVANLTQALQQVMAWQKQYQQMNDQKSQLQQQYAAATGNRGLGSYADDPSLRALVPADLQQLYENLRTKGAAGLSANARTLREQARIYNCDDIKGADQTNCQRLLNNLAQYQALLANALTISSARTTQIQRLQQAINTTDDPKSIAELQARLQAENVQVGNDANRLLLMRSMAETADRAAEQALREKTLLSLSRHSDGSDTFHYTLKPE